MTTYTITKAQRFPVTTLSVKWSDINNHLPENKNPLNKTLISNGQGLDINKFEGYFHSIL